jgi:hypothetical protein
MAVNEAAFKQEIKDSVKSLYPEKCVWCPTDKIQTGVTDLHIIIDQFYGIETKYCKKLPKRGSSKILDHTFSDMQIRFMTKLNKSGSAKGFGLIYIGDNASLLVIPEQLDSDGNLTREDAEKLFKEKDQSILKINKHWDIQKIVAWGNKNG